MPLMASRECRAGADQNLNGLNHGPFGEKELLHPERALALRSEPGEAVPPARDDGTDPGERGAGHAARSPGAVSGWTGQPMWGMTRNEMVWVSTRPVIVTVYAPAAIPVVSMLTLTVPLPSGPVTTGACTVE
jgi:hypothetical protein